MTPPSFPALAQLPALFRWIVVGGAVGCSLTSEPFAPEDTAPARGEQSVAPGRPGTTNNGSQPSPSNDPTASTFDPLQSPDAGQGMRSEGLPASLPLAPGIAEDETFGGNPQTAGAGGAPADERDAEVPPSCSGGACEGEPCADGVLGPGETDIDCGASCPLQCAPGQQCAGNADCSTRLCLAEVCVSPEGSPCSTDGECQTGTCSASLCAAPARCDDAVANGDESDVDCGGSNPFCPQCSDGSACGRNEDCVNGNCFDGTCVSCGSGTVDGDETDVDCGGTDPFCQRCQDGRQCRTASDCNNNNCFNGVCISCGSGTLDGDESDVDCGGADPFCRRCEPGLRCRQDSDCQFGICTNGFC